MMNVVKMMMMHIIVLHLHDNDDDNNDDDLRDCLLRLFEFATNDAVISCSCCFVSKRNDDDNDEDSIDEEVYIEDFASSS
jgi:hypothetical protein